MTSPAAGPLRALRAAVLASVVLTLGSVAHAAAGGGTPTPVVLVVLGLLLTPLVLVATRRRLGTGRAAAYLGGAQLGIHLVLHSLTPVAGTAEGVPPVHCGDLDLVTAAHASGALGASADLTAMADMAQMGGVLGLTPPMLLAHAVATGLTAWLLGRGEAILWRVVRALLPHRARPADIPVPHVPTGRTLARAIEAVRSAPVGPRAPPLPR